MAGIAAGVLALIRPQITALVLPDLIAAWAIVTGLFEAVAAFLLRRRGEGERVLALAGLVSVALGELLALRPGSGLIAAAWFVGAYGIVFGILLMVLGLRLRGLRGELW